MATSRVPSIIPMRTELFKSHEGFQPLAAGFLDAKVLEPLSAGTNPTWSWRPESGRIDGGDSIEDALLGMLRIVAPAPRTGALALLDQPSFGIGSLPPIPANVSGLTVISINLAKSYDLIDSLIKLVGTQGTSGSEEPGDHGTTRLGSAQGFTCEPRPEAGLLYAVRYSPANPTTQPD